MDALLLSDPDTDEWSINPVFERHLGMLKNLSSLGDVFAGVFPRLLDTYRLRTEGRGWWINE